MSETNGTSAQQTEAAGTGRVLRMTPNQGAAQAEETIDLRLLLGALLNKWYLLVAAFIVGAILYGGYTYMFVTPQYSSSSQIYVYAKSTISSMADLQIGSSLTADFQVIAVAETVHGLRNDLNHA